MNFLEETKEKLEENSKDKKDVLFVTNHGYYITWKQFAQIANFTYDNSWGAHEIDISLKVVGDDWWLERHEYDGSEWWEFKTLPDQPKTHKKNDLSPKFLLD